MVLMALLSAILVSVSIGLFLFTKPAWAIEIQRRFYARINWRIEPVSMTKELRNTRIMGIFLVALSLATIMYLCKVKP